MSNLIHCYDEYHGYLLVKDFIREQNGLPPKLRYKWTVMNELILSLIDQARLFFENNAYFITLCLHDRSILEQNSMKYIGTLRTCYLIHHSELLNNLTSYNSSEIIYESKTLTNSIRLINQFNFDSTFFQLILGILSFSTFNHTYYKNFPPNNLMDNNKVLSIQNIYIELAWKYLVCKYGDQQAIMYLSSFIRCLFSLNKSIIETIETEQCKDIIYSIIEQTEKTIIKIE